MTSFYWVRSRDGFKRNGFFISHTHWSEKWGETFQSIPSQKTYLSWQRTRLTLHWWCYRSWRDEVATLGSQLSEVHSQENEIENRFVWTPISLQFPHHFPPSLSFHSVVSPFSMAYSLTNFLITFFAFNVAILTWVFRFDHFPFYSQSSPTELRPILSQLHYSSRFHLWFGRFVVVLTIILLLFWITKALLFASFAPDGLLDLFLPELHNDDNYRFVASTVTNLHLLIDNISGSSTPGTPWRLLERWTYWYYPFEIYSEITL